MTRAALRGSHHDGLRSQVEVVVQPRSAQRCQPALWVGDYLPVKLALKLRLAK